MVDPLELSQFLLRLVLPALFGGVIGWEREISDKPAGLRTHMMVGLGSSAFTLLGVVVFDDLTDAGAQNIDPTRVIEGVAKGIGFLGAGAIIKSGRDPRGLTTAAGIWTVGGVGAACGAGYLAVAGATSAVALLVLLLGRFSWVQK